MSPRENFWFASETLRINQGLEPALQTQPLTFSGAKLQTQLLNCGLNKSRHNKLISEGVARYIPCLQFIVSCFQTLE